MSVITDALLTFDTLENGGKRLVEMYEALERQGSDGQHFADVAETAGGHKVLSPVYAAAFNHFGSDHILKSVQEVRWEYPKSVRLRRELGVLRLSLKDQAEQLSRK